jgi:hypothetical protein
MACLLVTPVPASGPGLPVAPATVAPATVAPATVAPATVAPVTVATGAASPAGPIAPARIIAPVAAAARPHPTVILSAAVSNSTTATTLPTPATTAPGSVITITGGPSATARIPGPQDDSADFYGIVLALAGIGIAIAVTRVVFGRWSRSGGSAGPRRSR